MKVGIVGMPNAGKSSLFNALTKAGAEAANYPFTTIEPNVAIVPVERRAPRRGRRDDRRVEPRPRHDRRSTTSPGSSRGAHEGEGLGNQFLANIRETDAIVHVVRAHNDDNVIHPEGFVDPLARHRDDRDRADLRRPRAGRAAPPARRAHGARRRQGRDRRGGVAARRSSRRSRRAARRGPSRRRRRRRTRCATSARSPPSRCCSSPTSTRATTRCRPRSPRTPTRRARRRRGLGRARGRAVRARRRGRRRDARRPRRSASPGLDRVVARRVRAARTCIAFFTAGEDKPAQSWHLRRGLSAWHAAGEIHSDIQKGFVRAEVIGWDELVDAGGYAGARDKGVLRLEGRDYVMRDGDVITVKFTP